MPHRKDIKGVLHNFLGTYTSRHADFDGYWLWGLLVEEFNELHIDLLQTIDSAATNATEYAVVLAVKKFREQIEKVGFEFLLIQEANLGISRSSTPRYAVPDGQTGPARAGYDLRFLAAIEFNDGKTFESEISIFVAPHDPKIESRRIRES